MSPLAAAEEAVKRADESLSRLDVDGLVAHLSAAVREFTAAGATVPAAMACVRLGEAMANSLGNITASRAWFARAARMLADVPECIEQGWVAVAPMGCDVNDPAVLRAAAELALQRARRFNDVNLETKALADGGLAHVQCGELDAGMAMLDEAMALACGPSDDRFAVAKSVCSFFTACYLAADFQRAASWAELLRRRGLIGTDGLGPLFLSSHCDSVQACLLVELGRWGEAEELLQRALDDFQRGTKMPGWHPAIALADLRVHQGRFAEAEALLIGKDQFIDALLPAARLHLARGDDELARATARRGLSVLGDDRLRAADLLMVLVHAELARGDVAAAQAAADDLHRRMDGVDIAPLQARAAAAAARIAAADGRLEAAITTLSGSARGLDGLPWRRATMLLDCAALREQAGDLTGALADANAARALLAELDVTIDPRQAAIIDRLCGGRRPPAAATACLAVDGKWWTASAGGALVRLAATKGLVYLAELIARPGQERHVLDLVDRAEGTGGVDRRSLGDAGPLLDAQARQAYRHRIEQLRCEAEEAVAGGRFDAAERLQDELDQLVQQLAQAFGLGGRARQAGSAAEKARLNVTRALRAATARIAEALPGAGAALDRSVRTGLYCAYEPVEGDARWIVQS